MEVERYGVYWVNLDPTIGKEIKKTRPVVVVSPDVMNRNLGTVLVCPLTTSKKKYPGRVYVEVNSKTSAIAIDHIRSIDKSRIGNRLGKLSNKESDQLVETILEVFKK
jgi:mRNA interferase MazF